MTPGENLARRRVLLDEIGDWLRRPWPWRIPRMVGAEREVRRLERDFRVWRETGRMP